jgi:uncharacterized membrane protein YgcG
MRVSLAKLVPSTLILASAMLAALAGCDEEEVAGACVRKDGVDAWCMEEKSGSYCEGTGYSFSPESTCSALGYAYYCTQSDMRASGSATVYAVERYLNNAACDPSNGAGPRAGSSSSSSSGGSSSGGSSSGGSSSGTGGKEICSQQNVQDCTIKYCAGGPQGCYYTANGVRFQCKCDDLTGCQRQMTEYCMSQ